MLGYVALTGLILTQYKSQDFNRMLGYVALTGLILTQYKSQDFNRMLGYAAPMGASFFPNALAINTLERFRGRPCREII